MGSNISVDVLEPQLARMCFEKFNSFLLTTAEKIPSMSSELRRLSCNKYQNVSFSKVFAIKTEQYKLFGMKCDVQRNSIHIPFETVVERHSCIIFRAILSFCSLYEIDNASIAQPYCLIMIWLFARCGVKYSRKCMRLCVKKAAN